MSIFSYFKKNHLFYFILPILIILLIVIYLIGAYEKSFDEAIFDVDRVYGHIKELSSPKYSGRLTGTKGNEEALKYVENYFKELGIEPAGENNTYYQHFDAVVAEVDSAPILQIKDEHGNVVEELKMYEDYRPITQSIYGGIDFEGELLFADKYLRKFKPQLIKDRVVVMTGGSSIQKDIDYLIENGAKGFLYKKIDNSNDQRRKTKSVSTLYKKSKTIFCGALGNKAYDKLKKYYNKELLKERSAKFGDSTFNLGENPIGIIERAKIKCEIDFPTKKTANILGKIQGKNKDGEYLIVGAHIDHVGRGLDEKYFPGALDNASGIAMMLELARTIKSQKIIPDKTIVFVGWNAEETGWYGSTYYVENPLYPLEKTQVLNFDCIGGLNAVELNFYSDEKNGKLLRSKFNLYAKNLNIKAKEHMDTASSDYIPFSRKGVPALNICDDFNNVHTYQDTMDNISKENLGKVGAVINEFIKKDIFKDTLSDT